MAVGLRRLFAPGRHGWMRADHGVGATTVVDIGARVTATNVRSLFRALAMDQI
jgi:hypothetical protein